MYTLSYAPPFLFTGELFDILVEYPDSTSALDDSSQFFFLTLFAMHTLEYSHPFLFTGELFDILVDYPDSTPALDDLRDCLQHTHQHSEVVLSLGEALEARLLKPGADTSNILQVYIYIYMYMCMNA